MSGPRSGTAPGGTAGRVSARWRRTLPAVLLAAFALVGCDADEGPTGPASVLGTITGSGTLGAAIVDLSWDGVLAFEGRGDTRVYSAAVAGEGDRHRLVLVGPAGGDLRFTIQLEDDRFYAPVVSIVSAVGSDNRPLPVDGLRVVLER